MVLHLFDLLDISRHSNRFFEPLFYSSWPRDLDNNYFSLIVLLMFMGVINLLFYEVINNYCIADFCNLSYVHLCKQVKIMTLF